MIGFTITLIIADAIQSSVRHSEVYPSSGSIKRLLLDLAHKPRYLQGREENTKNGHRSQNTFSPIQTLINLD